MRPAARCLEPHRGEGGVVAADRDQLRDAELRERVDGAIEQRRVLGRIGAGDAELRSAAEVNAADRVDGQRHDVVGVALHDPLEAVADAEDVDAFEAGADGGGADDALMPGAGPPPTRIASLLGLMV